MPRIARSLLCGQFLHVIVQGINKEKIFYKAEYKNEYKKLLQRETKNKNIDIVAYCIMDNHAHMLLFVKETKELSACMQKINTSYAIYFNKKEKRVGIVYRNRYYTKPINSEYHLARCIVYIHRNPVKAGIINNESQYEYSSYNEYYNKKEQDIIIIKSIEDIFGNIDNFRNIMNSIGEVPSKEFEIEDDIDYNKLIKEYRSKNLTDDIIIKKLSQEYKMSSRKIAELLGITRYYVRNNIENK